MLSVARPKSVAQGIILLVQVDSLLLRQTDVARCGLGLGEIRAVRTGGTRGAGHDPEGSPKGFNLQGIAFLVT